MRLAPAAVLRLAVLAAPLAAAGCRADTPVIREVPLVRSVLRDRPFPEGWRVVDLSQRLDAATPHVPHPRQFPFERMDLDPAERTSFRTGAFTSMEHSGTYLAAPRTRDPDGVGVDGFGGSDLLLPLAVVDVPVGLGATFATTDGAVRDQERDDGRIARGSAVFLRTGAAPGDAQHAGWTAAAVKWLVRERGVRVVGTDGPVVDLSRAAKAPAQGAAADEGVWTVAGLRRLDELPRRGAWVVVGALPIAGGAGAPARVVALVPPGAAPDDDAAR